MGKLASIIAFALGGLLLFALFIGFVVHDAGTAQEEIVYDPSGTIRYASNRTLLRRQDNYWKPDGSLDQERSGQRYLGLRWRPLSPEEVRTISKWRWEYDLAILSRAVTAYMNREEVLGRIPQIDHSAPWGRRHVPHSMAKLIAHAQSRHELHDCEGPLRDAWGREYLLRVEDDPDAPFEYAVRVTVYTRGSDGVAGGTGDAEDHGMALDWRGWGYVTEIP